MKLGVCVVWLSMSVGFGSGDASAQSARPVPSSGTLQRLSWETSNAWLHVTLDSTRLELRARRIDANGLGGLRLREGAIAPHDPIEWARIERIEAERRHTIRGALLGTLIGGIGVTAAAKSGDFFFAGAIAGGAAGGWIGGRLPHDVELYRAPAATTPAPMVAPADTMSPAPAALAEPAAKPAAPLAIAPRTMEKLALQISSKKLLRIRGSEGVRFGYVSDVGPEGLLGFRAAPSYEQPAPIDRIAWAAIEQIDTRGGSGGRSAKYAATSVGLSCGLLGALLSAAVVSNGDSDVSTGGAMLAGGLAAGGIGAVLGGLIGAGAGAAVPSWHPVYVRR